MSFKGQNRNSPSICLIDARDSQLHALFADRQLSEIMGFVSISFAFSAFPLPSDGLCQAPLVNKHSLLKSHDTLATQAEVIALF